MNTSKLPVTKLFEFWLRIECPFCKAMNWVYQSHSQRDYYGGEDVTVCKCYKCIEVFRLTEFEEGIDDPNEEPVNGKFASI